MTAFDIEQIKTSGKMADLVMEYVSQFIARDYFEAYERATETGKDALPLLTPIEYDEKIYKKLTKLVKNNTRYKTKPLRSALKFFTALLCVFCLAFTLFVLSNDALRGGVINILF
jgi:hypothetical protein